MALQQKETDGSEIQASVTDTYNRGRYDAETKDPESGDYDTKTFYSDDSEYYREQRQPQHTALRTVYNVGLRLLTLGASVAAFVIMITNKQTIRVPYPLNGVIIDLAAEAKWQYSSAFVWFVVATAIVSVYISASIVLVGFMAALSRHAKHQLSSALPWTVFVFDLIMMNVLMSALASAIDNTVIGEYGNKHTNWAEICNRLDYFCGHAIGALAAAVIAFLGLLQLCILDTFLLHIHNRYKKLP